MFDVYQWPQKMFDGTTATFEMAKRPDTVEAICIVDDKLILLQQQQPGTNVYLDLPSGRHDVVAETELQAAQREVKEETGYSFAKWRLIECSQRDYRIERFVYTFLAWDMTESAEPKLDGGERIEVKLQTLDEMKALINTNRTQPQLYDFLCARFWYNCAHFEELLKLPDITK